jgi:hypothetical protein
MPYGIGRKEPSSIRSIKDEMPGRKSFDTASDLVETFSECTGRRKLKMTGSIQSNYKSIRRHLFTELAASQDNEF